MLFISLRSETLPLSTVNEYGDITIAQALSQIQGVAQVVIFGSQKFAVRVQADPEAAAARGLSLGRHPDRGLAREFLHAGRHAERAETGRGASGFGADGQGGRLPAT